VVEKLRFLTNSVVSGSASTSSSASSSSDSSSLSSASCDSPVAESVPTKKQNYYY
jgi:hypothetical protein